MTDPLRRLLNARADLAGTDLVRALVDLLGRGLHLRRVGGGGGRRGDDQRSEQGGGDDDGSWHGGPPPNLS